MPFKVRRRFGRRKAKKGGFSHTSDGRRVTGGKLRRRSIRGRSGRRLKGRSFRLKLLKQLEPQIITSEHGDRAWCPSGMARYFVANMLRPTTDMRTIFQNASIPTAPNTNSLGGIAGVASNIGQFGPQQSKIYTKTWARTEFINGHIAPIKLWFYTLWPKFPIKSTQIQAQPNSAPPAIGPGYVAAEPPNEAIFPPTGGFGAAGVNNTNNMFGEAATDIDVKNLSTAGGSNNLYTIPSLTLWDFPRMTNSFRIKGGKSICLNPGKCISHVMKGDWQRFNQHQDDFLPSVINKPVASLAFMRQPILLVKMMGVPTVDQTTLGAPLADAGTVSSGSAFVNFVSQRKYYVKTLWMNTRMVINPIASLPTGITQANESYMTQPVPARAVASGDT